MPSVRSWSFLVLCLAGTVLIACMAAQSPTAVSILVFTKTAQFRHDAIPDAVNAIKELGTLNGFDVRTTEDATAFTDDNLRQYRAVVFALTTGDVLNDAQQGALERFVNSGGGWVGIHAASDTEYSWAWYGQLLGAYFQNHPPGFQDTVVSADGAHPLARAIPSGGWKVRDELYNFRTNPRGSVRVLATLDERSYQGGTMGADHPITWCRDFDGGRAWYTGLGHTKAMYTEPTFRALLLAGIRYAAGIDRVTCTP
jgi:type 1 glutamine amidotransferase